MHTAYVAYATGFGEKVYIMLLAELWGTVRSWTETTRRMIAVAMVARAPYCRMSITESQKSGAVKG
jgi:hypothetical protein